MRCLGDALLLCASASVASAVESHILDFCWPLCGSPGSPVQKLHERKVFNHVAEFPCTLGQRCDDADESASAGSPTQTKEDSERDDSAASASAGSPTQTKEDSGRDDAAASASAGSPTQTKEDSGPKPVGRQERHPYDRAPADDSTREATTAASALSQMGTGINLGNTFDLPELNKDWQMFDRNMRMIDKFVDKGFTHMVIPVTWGGRFDPHSNFTSMVTRAVHYALWQGLWVVVDAHHEKWLKCCYDGSAEYNDRFSRLWVSIATHFKAAGDHLLFSVLNEPEGAFGDWSNLKPAPTELSGQELTRQICNVGIAAIRSVSATRIALCSPNAQGNTNQAAVVFPDTSAFAQWDSYIGVTVHSYDDWGFCGQDGKNDYWDTGTMRDYYQGMLSTLDAWHVDSGIPVHFGEFGVGRIDGIERDADIVRDYYRFMSEGIRRYNIPPTLWEDGGWYALIKDFEWVYGLADAALGFAPASAPPRLLFFV